jgi:hypothetical protein
MYCWFFFDWCLAALSLAWRRWRGMPRFLCGAVSGFIVVKGVVIFQNE